MGETQATRGCSSFSLKMIAVITMFIDHTAAIILARALVQGTAAGYVTQLNYGTWELIYEVMRAIGRMSFPIYCFLLVEGFLHTRNVGKYLGRMELFAVVSEIPFDLAFSNRLWNWNYNNVFVTLFLGLVVIVVIHWIDETIQVENKNLFYKYLKCFAIAAAILAGMVAAEVMHTDYSASGVAAISIMYVFRSNRMISFGSGVAALGIIGSPTEFYALLMLYPIYKYHGVQGPKAKYFFYAFYPVHILVLYEISRWMGL